MRTTLAVAAAVVLLAGCSDDGPSRAQDPGPVVDELAAHGGEVCPVVLPRDPDDRFAFGTDRRAEQLPSTPEITEAWMCFYGLADARGSWERAGDAVPLDETQVSAAEEAVAGLGPFEQEACTDDLGPLHLLVTVRDGKDLTGYAADSFGCRAVRVTDDPFETVPGEATQDGTVGGTLEGGQAIVDLVAIGG